MVNHIKYLQRKKQMLEKEKKQEKIDKLSYQAFLRKRSITTDLDIKKSPLKKIYIILLLLFASILLSLLFIRRTHRTTKEIRLQQNNTKYKKINAPKHLTYKKSSNSKSIRIPKDFRNMPPEYQAEILNSQ